jgi:hypothetical protein
MSLSDLDDCFTSMWTYDVYPMSVSASHRCAVVSTSVGLDFRGRPEDVP